MTQSKVFLLKLMRNSDYLKGPHMAPPFLLLLLLFPYTRHLPAALLISLFPHHPILTSPFPFFLFPLLLPLSPPPINYLTFPFCSSSSSLLLSLSYLFTIISLLVIFFPATHPSILLLFLNPFSVSFLFLFLIIVPSLLLPPILPFNFPISLPTPSLFFSLPILFLFLSVSLLNPF